MKGSIIRKSFVLGMAMMLATAAFAANKGTLNLTDPVTVAGKQLAAGSYTVTWEGTGPSVEAKFLKGKNVVATTPARLVKVKQRTNNGITSKQNSDGSYSLTGIQFDGKNYALTIGEDSTQADASSSMK